MFCYNEGMELTNDFSEKFKSGNFFYSLTSDAKPKEDNYYRHNHSRYELYIFFEGEVDFIIEDHLYPLKKGNILLIQPLSYHYANLKNTRLPYVRLILNFDRNLVFPELQSFLDSKKEFFVWDEKNHALMLEDLRAHLSSYHASDSALLIQLFLNRLLMDFKYSEKHRQNSQILNPSVTQILKFINEHIYEPLSLKRIAAQMFLNQSYLSQIFSSYMKIGLMDYIKQKKIHLAHEMIQNKDVPPTDACKILGFNDYSTFYRLYKKYINQLPSAHE